MGKSYNGAHKEKDRELQSLMAAGLICGFRQSSHEKIYEKALKCFDVLLDILEDSDIAGKVSTIVNSPVTAVKNSAQAIIDLLLFNAGNDPYISLCLPRYAREEEVNRRWKRLIVYYHPDKYSNRLEYEERAKRINESYEAVQKMKEGLHIDEAVREIIRRNADYESFNDEINRRMSKGGTSFRHKYLKRLPAFILLTSLVITMISILLFLYAG